MASDLRPAPPQTTPLSTDDFPELTAGAIQLGATIRAFMKFIQRSNDCRASGFPCRLPELCGCYLEMQDAIGNE